MIAFIKKIDYLPTDICGYANGYVAIPPSHPLYEKHYDDVNIHVHGGLTFSDWSQFFESDNIEILGTETELPEDWWVFGFDTCHYGDNKDNWNKEACIRETLRLKNILKSYE